MSERCITTDHEIRGKPYEVWVDGSRNWWLAADHHKPGWVLTEDDFDPKLTEKELQAIWDYIYDRMAE